MITKLAQKALTAYRARGSTSLHDQVLEKELFKKLEELEELVGRIGPTPLRHELGERIIQMRVEIWAYNQAQDES